MGILKYTSRLTKACPLRPTPFPVVGGLTGSQHQFGGTMEHFLCALLRMQRCELGIHYFRTEEAQGDLELTTAAVTQLLLVFKANASL